MLVFIKVRISSAQWGVKKWVVETCLLICSAPEHPPRPAVRDRDLLCPHWMSKLFHLGYMFFVPTIRAQSLTNKMRLIKRVITLQPHGPLWLHFGHPCLRVSHHYLFQDRVPFPPVGEQPSLQECYLEPLSGSRWLLLSSVPPLHQTWRLSSMPSAFFILQFFITNPGRIQSVH